MCKMTNAVFLKLLISPKESKIVLFYLKILLTEI